MEVERYEQYIDILREELIPAMGCTEPIALAYAAAVGRQELGCLPERILARVSSNIIKNVKSVVVPNTGGLRGIPAVAGIAYLNGSGLDEVKHTLVNAMAIDSGIICDGAKASCAAKIASAVDAGLLGYQMYMQGNEFLSGDGIVKKNVEETISTVGSLAHNGMCDTDVEILRLMLED